MPIGSNINLEQKKELLDKAIKESEKLFTSGEKHLCAAVQQKLLLNLLPHSIIVTNKRVVKHIPGVFKATFEDYLWKDLKDVHLIEKVFGAQLNFEFNQGSIVIENLPKNQAKKIYTIAQEREEEWVEKRRLRDMEETRAKSGGSHINIGNQEKSDTKSKLLELKSLLEEDLITQDEYQRKKAEILKEV